MNTVLDYLPQATSIIFLLFIIFRLYQKNKALNRELLSSKEIKTEILPDPTIELEKLKQEMLLELEQLKTLEKERLEEELREKRHQNDVEIQEKQELVNKLLQDYQTSQKEALTLSINAERLAAQELLAQDKLAMEDELLEVQAKVFFEKAILEQMRANQIGITEALMREAVNKQEFHLHFNESDQGDIKDLQTVARK